MKLIFRVFIIICFLFGIISCNKPPKEKLVVFAAGSLIKPFGDLEKAFEKEHPNVDVQMEYHGSIQVIRHVTDLNEKIDVVATADQVLIPYLMYDKTDKETGLPFANWYARFATNKMALAYTANSLYSDEINEANWLEILSRPDVKIGLADPRFDASGYRSLMILKLAETSSSKNGLFNSVFDGQFKYPLKVDEGGGYSIIRVPEVLEPVDDSRIVIRGGSIQLLSLLESGDVDFAFEYESVIRQHNLKMVQLPQEINLGNPDFNQQYGKVTVKLDFQRFASVKPEFTGEQISYGIVIPTNSPNPKSAADFIAFLYNSEGRMIMEQNFHPIIYPPVIDHPENAPQSLMQMETDE